MSPARKGSGIFSFSGSFATVPRCATAGGACVAVLLWRGSRIRGGAGARRGAGAQVRTRGRVRVLLVCCGSGCPSARLQSFG